MIGWIARNVLWSFYRLRQLTFWAQQAKHSGPDVLTSTEKQTVANASNLVAKQLQALQKQAHTRVLGRLPASERNVKLVCTLSHTGKLDEREGNEVGVVSFVGKDPANDPALRKLLSTPQGRATGEYSFQHFDVAVWPARSEEPSGSMAVRVELRQSLYWDWADSHITDDSLKKDWWRLIAPECR